LIILPAYLLFPQWPEHPTPYVLFLLLAAPGYISYLRRSFFSLSFCRTPGGLYVKALSKSRVYEKLLFEQRFVEGSDVLVAPIIYARHKNTVSLMYAIVVSPPEGDDIRSFGYLSERTANDRKARLEAFLKNANESHFMLTGQEPQWAALGLMWGGGVLALVSFVLGI
ncbi:MAG TPA: hypothetical protein PLP17_15055, partial [Oligoflexia bacterium]|nr:hypothetical protein [Oligoflexia bacterium]